VVPACLLVGLLLWASDSLAGHGGSRSQAEVARGMGGLMAGLEHVDRPKVIELQAVICHHRAAPLGRQRIWQSCSGL
jgi:hypothetical protein